jgi:hypothetical protein
MSAQNFPCSGLQSMVRAQTGLDAPCVPRVLRNQVILFIGSSRLGNFRLLHMMMDTNSVYERLLSEEAQLDGQSPK